MPSVDGGVREEPERMEPSVEEENMVEMVGGVSGREAGANPSIPADEDRVPGQGKDYVDKTVSGEEVCVELDKLVDTLEPVMGGKNKELFIEQIRQDTTLNIIKELVER